MTESHPFVKKRTFQEHLEKTNKIILIDGPTTDGSSIIINAIKQEVHQNVSSTNCSKQRFEANSVMKHAPQSSNHLFVP